MGGAIPGTQYAEAEKILRKMKITEDDETKLKRLIAEGQTFFEATAMYPNFSENDAYQLFSQDVTALRKLARVNNFTVTETKETRSGDRYLKSVRIASRSLIHPKALQVAPEALQPAPEAVQAPHESLQVPHKEAHCCMLCNMLHF
jgi:hypothetical protein